jgi:hypothetical protein
VKQTRSWVVLAAAALWLSLFPGCPAEGVGDPCVPEDEYSATFSGFSVTEVSTESRSFQCQSRLCLVNHFQGRVSCPYGQEANGGHCKLPGSNDPVNLTVKPQLLERRDEDAVYCSCRCAGPDAAARYCDCPSGFSCSEVVPDLGRGGAQLPGKYCIRAGSAYDKSQLSENEVCDRALGNCGAE